MAEQQLFCDPDDRHRAVLVAGCLKDMGQPTRLVDQPEAPASRALLLWTNRASRSPWLSRLLRDHRDLIVVAIDSAPLPADCPHVLMLTTWPARSADRSLGELVSWLQGSPGPGPFARRAKAASEPGSGSALLVLGLLVLLVGAVVLGSGGSDGSNGKEGDLPEPDGTPEVSSRVIAVEPRSTTLQPSPSPSPSPSARAGSASIARQSAAAASPQAGLPGAAGGSAPLVNAGAAAPAPAEQAAGALPVEPLAAPAESLAEGGLPAENSSLDHLCRARSLAAAQAWYRVLTPRQRALAPALPCVRALLARPGFEPLREEIQA